MLLRTRKEFLCPSARHPRLSSHLHPLFHRHLCCVLYCSPRMSCHRQILSPTPQLYRWYAAMHRSSIHTGISFQPISEFVTQSYGFGTMIFSLIPKTRSDSAFFHTKRDLRKPSLFGCPFAVSERLKNVASRSTSISDRCVTFAAQWLETLPCIDYCNALHYEVPDKTIDTLRVYNGLAPVIFGIGVRKFHDSEIKSMALLKKLHWLPIRSRIESKVMLLYVTRHIVF